MFINRKLKVVLFVTKFNIMYRRVTLLIVYLLFLTTYCSSQSVKKSWQKVLKNCGRTETFGKYSLFFGPSNTIGLGSVWRKTENKGYSPRFELEDLISDSTQRARIIKRGQVTETCKTLRDVEWTSRSSIPFLGKIFKLDGEVSAQLNKARRTTLSVDNLSLDVIKELPFELAIKNITEKDNDNPYVKDLLLNENRLLVTKAYRLTGMEVKLDFDPEVIDSLKSKYPEGAQIKLGGENGLDVSFNFKAANQLTLKLPNEVYIVGELARISKGGTIQLTSSSTIKFRLKPIKVDEEASIGPIEGLVEAEE